MIRVVKGHGWNGTRREIESYRVSKVKNFKRD